MRAATSDEAKIVHICGELLKLGMTPKQFMMGFLSKKHPLLRYRRRTWATKHGWASTINLIRLIRNEFHRTRAGLDKWAHFIQQETVKILRVQSTPKGNYPSGSFQSARSVTRDFFTQSAIDERNNRLTLEDTPFLFNVIFGALAGEVEEDDHEDEVDADIEDYLEKPQDMIQPLPNTDIMAEVYLNDTLDSSNVGPEDTIPDPTKSGKTTGYLSSSSEPLATSEQPHNSDATSDCDIDVETNGARIAKLSAAEAEELSHEGYIFTTSDSSGKGKHHRARHIATVVCSMVGFSRNRRANGLQLTNAIRFLACGVSETVNEYAHYMGLCSSRKTAIQALRSLTQDAHNRIVNACAETSAIAPPLCIDNLDMEERVHQASIGKQTRMFHGTWGYIHIPSKSLMDTLDPQELTLLAYHNSLKHAASMEIEPDLFLPNDPSGDEYELVLKSQIAQVMLRYVATPSDKKKMVPLHPPTVEQILAEKPDIHMLKLMDESDNSAEGIGQVMEALQRQSGLDETGFFGRLQLVDGDLGTSQIFNALRSLRLPSEYPEHNLDNVHFTLGAAHTLWNIAQTILTTHLGNSNKSDDLGVWRYLDALGISPEKVIQKKDFTKMIQAMELVHEATLFYCLRKVLNIHTERIEEHLPVISTESWNHAVETCYNEYCSPLARRNAVQQKNTKLANLLIRMQDFSTVIEANRAMKAGDVGRLLRIWKMWSIMTQSLPGLTHYSAYLPRLVLLLTVVLPPSLAKLIRHNLLVSPSGRPNHFVAKDFLLETNNYWLKYFFNRAGVGTQIERLKELFSSNIPLLRSMFQSLRIDSGGKHFQQSHKTYLHMRALERFNQMAQDNAILDDQAVSGVDVATTVLKKKGQKPPQALDTYLRGIQCLQSEYGKNDGLGRFLLHFPLYEDQDTMPVHNDETNKLLDNQDSRSLSPSDDEPEHDPMEIDGALSPNVIP
ncbi:hypothetical protein Pst134EA_011854 [Puccinia striiformis f. sp. tritici]|uniref:DUF6589 domain-containing protein n=4 Tax=Puccinia striiformis TaxID=27350 RepID=A0A2S4V4Z8_9BASI|nr:hypothetical protein Pst134EA_011854 [Puccinia striiformis f. sp. tritici]KAH9468225.1 hypothetical protein Pst134EA_011854 [Puccinia striiformis f. sp. tritici]POW04603.1 hypothetical protein PSHT_11158 [Puccinia striiformis]